MSKILVVEINRTIEIELEDYEVLDIIEQYGAFDADKAFKYCLEEIESESSANLDLNSNIWIEDDEEEEC